MEKPLFLGRIKGTASAGLEYQPREGDEVEDLLELLKRVKEGVPVEGVSSGAILSTYQKNRVESVALRLGLTSLAPLWKRAQGPLLAAMGAGGLRAVLLKVACFRLASKHLGRPVDELAGLFSQLEAEFGMNVCGEGGEYETLVLDCPLFRRKLELLEWEVRGTGLDTEGEVAYLLVGRARLVPK
jgi:diphthine-ammonia ligase